ncbi:MBL fold metallo-hydrolase [Lyngbya aestuarii]|uniref:MBL fold metallo-hydrolase n=1 Tax=Lyngbya aestuarii TaxID=118322 RepID=UPI00403DFAF3
MQPDLPQQGDFILSQRSSSKQPEAAFKPPHSILETIFAFPPSRDTLGGTAYLIVENTVNILIDCPAWNETNEQFLHQQGGISLLFLTHRGGIGRVQEFQSTFGCPIIIQEQEAYLLPGLNVRSFQKELTITPRCCAIWTPGHSPGSACLYYTAAGGVLFSGRHLLPNRQGEPVPWRTSKTFHWPRQLQSVESLKGHFTAETLSYICPGANTGFLRGKGVIDQAYQSLSRLNRES